MPANTLTALLLTGGLSTRMGTDKATLPVGLMPLWEKQLQTLRELHPDVLAVSARTAMPWIPPSVKSILDSPPSQGPLSGIVAALRSLPTSHLLALAVDMPRMTTAHLAMLWEMASPGQGVIPQRNGALEPLCAIYPVESLPTAEEFMKKEMLSVRRFGQALLDQSKARTYPVPPAEEVFYLNLNTPADIPPATRAN